MAYVAILSPLVVALFALWGGLQMLRQRERSFDRREQAWLAERKDLLNRVMYMAERPWEMPEATVELPPPAPPPEIVDPLLEVI